MVERRPIPELADFSATELSEWIQFRAPESPSVLLANQIYRRLQEQELPGLRRVRIAVLRSATIEPLCPYLCYQAARMGFQVSVWINSYGDWGTQSHAEDGPLYAGKPEAISLFLCLENLSPRLSEDFSSLSAEDRAHEKEVVVEEIERTVEALRRHSTAKVLVHNFPLISYPANGLFDSQAAHGQNDMIAELNREVRLITQRYSDVYVFDYCLWSARVGLDNLCDRNLWLTAQVPISGKLFNFLAIEYVRYLSALIQARRKCLVVDLDNTLWGGVLGEDGLNGIQMGTAFPGRAYRDLQLAIRDLYHRGIILAICSKNDESEVRPVLEQHPDMVLKPEHFAAMRINWEDKATNLRAIAAELNVGLNSLALLDDSPTERELIRQLLSDVMVIDWPANIGDCAAILRRTFEFETLSITEEDRRRGEMYREQVARQRLQGSSSSLEDYYKSLQMQLQIGVVDDHTIPRVSQLTQKTNQFNLTTRRYSEREIQRMAADEGWLVYWLKMNDRFGDSGLTGVGILHRIDNDLWEIDLFLMSCRVLGRTAEEAFLAFLIDRVRQWGGRVIRGWFLPTKANTPARGFYERAGFRLVKQEREAELWELSTSDQGLKVPDWFVVDVLEAKAEV